jgi:hypothetical protein
MNRNEDDMQAIFVEHPPEEALERYLLDHAPEKELIEVETHLFVCEQCMDRVEHIREFQVTLRDGFALYRDEAARKAEARTPSVFARLLNCANPLTWRVSGRLPPWAIVAATAAPLLGALLLGVFLRSDLRQPSGAPFDVSLTALRGDESGTEVPTGRKIEFHLNVEGLGPTPFSVMVVDSDGRPVGPVQPSVGTEHPVVELPPFRGGTYFLRLYVTKDGHADQNKLLREFSFQAR